MELKVGLLGLGNVGSGVLGLLEAHRDVLAARCGGVHPVVTKVLVRDMERTRAVRLGSATLTTNVRDILDDPDIGVIIELMGGTEPALGYVQAALRAGKHVVLGNKELMARHGVALLEEAHQKSVALLFEASVAGGIPILRAIRESLNGDRILSLQGIVNGTTNYILSRMSVDGLSFEAALHEAQARGYAEADPSNDILGVDAMYKLAILIAIAFGTPVDIEHLHHRGINQVQATDIQYARDLGYVVKLLAEARDDGGLFAGVEPCLVPSGHPLAAVMSNFNAVLVRGDWAGDLMFYGQGAGARPTATAVVSDLLQICHAVSQGNKVSIPGGWWQQTPRVVRPLEEQKDRHYLRLQVFDQPGVLAAVAHVFAVEKVSFQSVLQKSHGEDPVDVVFMTHRASGAAIKRATDQVCELESVQRGRRRVPSHLMWRGVIGEWGDYLPEVCKERPITLLEGNTPLIPAIELSKLVGAAVWFKFEGMNPTGSFKDRGMVTAMSAALASGATSCICASTGNTAASAAAYAARGGLTCYVVVPQGKVAMGKLAGATVHGARILEIEGNFDAALKMVRELAEKRPIALVNSVNPYRIEGQKTAAFEVVQTLKGRTPDVVVLPVGNAGNITAYWKGFTEYRTAGVTSAVPRMIGIQAAGAAPLVHGHAIEDPQTLATAIRIGNPASWTGATTAVTESRGGMYAVTDDQILEAYRFLATREGIFAEPASVAPVAWLLSAESRKLISGGETVVCILTGHGLKDPDTALRSAAAVQHVAASLEALDAAIGETAGAPV